jgi:hypothetical protein
MRGNTEAAGSPIPQAGRGARTSVCLPDARVSPTNMAPASVRLRASHRQTRRPHLFICARLTNKHGRAASPALIDVVRQLDAAEAPANDVRQAVAAAHERHHHQPGRRLAPAEQRDADEDQHVVQRAAQQFLPETACPRHTATGSAARAARAASRCSDRARRRNRPGRLCAPPAQ